MNEYESGIELYRTVSTTFSDLPGRSNDRDQSWKQQLEKAYFDKQVEVMKSTGPLARTSFVSELDDEFNTYSTSYELLSVTANSLADQSLAQVGRIRSLISPEMDISLRAEQGPSSSFQNKLGMSVEALVNRPKTEGAVEVERTAAIMKSLSTLTPNKDSVRILIEGNQAHLVIRNGELEPFEQTKLIEQVKNILRGKQLFLSKVIINGKIYWESKFSSIHEDLQQGTRDEDQFMDRVF